MRSDLSPSLSFPLGRSIWARCWYSKTLSGDERHYPHQSELVGQEGRTVGHLGSRSRALEPERPLLTNWPLQDVVLQDRVPFPSRRDSNG